MICSLFLEFTIFAIGKRATATFKLSFVSFSTLMKINFQVSKLLFRFRKPRTKYYSKSLTRRAIFILVLCTNRVNFHPMELRSLRNRLRRGEIPLRPISSRITSQLKWVKAFSAMNSHDTTVSVRMCHSLSIFRAINHTEKQMDGETLQTPPASPPTQTKRNGR